MGAGERLESLVKLIRVETSQALTDTTFLPAYKQMEKASDAVSSALGTYNGLLQLAEMGINQ